MRATTSRVLALVLSAGLVSCARPDVQTPVKDTQDYVFPAWEPGDVRPEEGREIETAWRDVLAGHTSRAARRMRELLEQRPGLVSAEAVAGYAALREGRHAQAARWFESALARRPDFVPALVGAAVVAGREGDTESALGFARRGAEQRPEDPGLARRVARLKLAVVEARTESARAARAGGDVEGAIADLRVALDVAPELAHVRLELANALVDSGRREEAMAVLRAVPDDDREVLLRLAEVLGEARDVNGVLQVYRRLLAAQPDDEEVRARAQATARLLERAAATPEYWRIPTAARVTRADLAALVALKVTALDRVEAGEPEVAVDISGSWARESILDVLAHGLMDVYPNHTFQPGAAIRRGELAHVVGGVLERVSAEPVPPLEIADMSPRHRYHRGASRAIQAGLMQLDAAGNFEPWRPVNGAEATGVIETLARRLGP